MRVPYSVEPFRYTEGPYRSCSGDDFGAFHIPGPAGEMLTIIASPGDASQGVPFEHVSVSTRRRCPIWAEMCFVKDLFWGVEEAVMQLHPPRSKYVNNHRYCLHLWRPTQAEIPLPPEFAVGYKFLNLPEGGKL